MWIFTDVTPRMRTHSEHTNVKAQVVELRHRNEVGLYLPCCR